MATIEFKKKSISLDSFEENINIQKSKNEKLIEEFSKWLESKKLSKKTIEKHLYNSDFYINEFLLYYESQEPKDGMEYIDGFLGDFFIRKCMWSSKATIKENATSLKKFYQFMSEIGKVSKEDYKEFVEGISDSMEFYLDSYDMMMGVDF